jgi:hypothetical protein
LKIFAIVLAVSFEKVQDLRIVFFTEPGIFLKMVSELPYTL